MCIFYVFYGEIAYKLQTRKHYFYLLIVHQVNTLYFTNFLPCKACSNGDNLVEAVTNTMNSSHRFISLREERGLSIGRYERVLFIIINVYFSKQFIFKTFPGKMSIQKFFYYPKTYQKWLEKPCKFSQKPYEEEGGYDTQ